MNRGLILLVEDNEDDELLTLMALKDARIVNPVAVARDGQAAIDYLSSQHNEVPAVILLDLNLPKVSGLEVLTWARHQPRTRLVPVVCLTSSKQESDVVAGYAEGCNSYICKPVEFSEFSRAVGQLGMYWLMMNEAAPRV